MNKQAFIRPTLTLAIMATTFGALALAAGQTQADPARDALTIPPEIAQKMAAMAKMAAAGQSDKKPDFPPFEKVVEGFEKVISTADGQRSLYTIWKRESDARMLAELPSSFEGQQLFIATTVAGGEPTAGIQFGDMYVHWKRYDKKLALIEPNVAVRSSGDAESRSSRNLLFTGRVVLSVPIVTMSPGGGPVIDLNQLLLDQSSKFFGYVTRGADTSLAHIAEAKAFPNNVELAYELPVQGGQLKTLHYSISVIPNKTGYKPRLADERVGFFTTAYRDLANPSADTPWVRYINRWDIQKADPSLKLSPPKKPIVFYIESTTPVRWRRWVREGILFWNKAFENIGIDRAIEVYQQDARTGAHMEKDPEDVRYNFLRWNTNGERFAIGPSRVDPRTGQILDADVVMNDGLIKTFAIQWTQLVSDIATEGFTPETLEWLNSRPKWDPRVRLAPVREQRRIIAQRQRKLATGAMREGGHPAAAADPTLIGDDPYDGLSGRISQVNGQCALGDEFALELSLFGLTNDLLGVATDKQDDEPDFKIPDDVPEAVRAMILQKFAELKAKGKLPPELDGALQGEQGDDADKDNDDEGDDADQSKKKPDDLLDGMPEEFIGPIIRYIIAHEIGHTMGLRHNFRGSTIHSLEELNSDPKPSTALSGSVMDYIAPNINTDDGPKQGDWATMEVGPYDMWAIEYGYTSEKNLKPILSRVAEPELAYATDEDTWGPDPRARRWDLGADSLNYAESRLRLVNKLRPLILERAVKDGQSWSKAREAYNRLLAEQITAVSIAANWIGGSYINRDKKGDPDGRAPIENIPAATQRRALQLLINNIFEDDAFGLTTDLLERMTVDKWWDQGGFRQIFDDPTWNIHDQILAIQSASLTMVMNPTTLRRVFDNELRIPSDQDAITLPDVLFSISDAIWSELDKGATKRYTDRKPMISSLRRNLQREHLERLIDLSMPGGMFGAASKPIADLALLKLHQLRDSIESLLQESRSRLDVYTLAHLTEVDQLINKALDSQYIYNANDIGGSGQPFIIFGVESERTGR